jgi:polyisoprenoid-binding protein YceI
MKRILSTLISSLLVFIAPNSLHAADTLAIDSNHSFVQWHIKHLGFSQQTGKWYVTGTILIDKDKPQDSKVDVKIDINNLVTGLPELDKHLKSKLFFDAEKYPTATFVSNKVDVTGKDTAKVTGILTLRGMSKPVTLDVVLNKVGENPINNKMTAGFTAKTEIKRSDFGMNAFLPNVGDDVSLEIEVEASPVKS